MKGSQYLLATILVAAVSSSWANEMLGGAQKLQEAGHRLMHTDIAIVGADQANLKTHSKDGVYVDASNLIDQASGLDGKGDDVEEDENDRFITSRSGKVRPMYIDSEVDKETDWANEAPVGTLKAILFRKKRCGGGGDDDDDGDANRSRRARRTKRVKRRKVRKNNNKGTVTTVTRKVTQNGQVISHTTETQQSQQPATVLATQQQVPVVADASQPVVQHTISTQHTVQVQAQPATIQQVAQPVVQVQTQPEVVQAAAVAAPTVVQQTVPGSATVVQAV